MKQTLAMLLAALCLFFPLSALSAYQNGVYQDTGEGYRGPILAEITLTDGRIVNMEVRSATEQEDEFLQTAADGLIHAILTSGSLEGVDTVGGATASSNGILAAARGVLEQASAGAGENTVGMISSTEESARPTPRPTPDASKATQFVGLGSAANFRTGPGKDSKDVQVYSFNVVMAAALFDRQGKIQHVKVDVYEVSTPNYDGASMPHFSGWPGTGGYNVTDHETGKVTGVSDNSPEAISAEVAAWVTKRERGDQYGMNPENDWHRQMDAYEQWMLGKTTDEIRSWFARYTSPRNGRPIKLNSDNAEDKKLLAAMSEQEKQALADVSSMATMSLSDSHGLLLEAVEKAYANRQPVAE